MDLLIEQVNIAPNGKRKVHKPTELRVTGCHAKCAALTDFVCGQHNRVGPNSVRELDGETHDESVTT